MSRMSLRTVLLALPLVLSGCDVALNLFSVPAQATAGGLVTITIDGAIRGDMGP